MNSSDKCSDKYGAFFVWFNYEEKNFEERNTILLNTLDIDEKSRIYVSKNSPTAIVFLDEKKKLKIEKEYELTPYLFTRPEKMGDEIVLNDISADCVLGNDNSPQCPLGTGVKVGVIAVENLIFDENAKSLEGLEIVVFPSIIPPRTDRHPTCVMSEIIGRRLDVEGMEFSGVARDATLYFDALYSVKEMFESIERMIESGVRIINFSAGTYHDGIYNDFDRQIDRLIVNNDFLLVCAAGNYVKLASPAKSYNCLTVGNAVTKSAPATPLSPPFTISSTSAYSTNNNLPHKPEIVAPGEWIGFVNSEGQADFENFGTSFATPLVTGAVARLLSKKDLSYLTLKALILLSASEEKISPLENSYIQNSQMRLKSGYGLLDAQNSINILERARIIEGRLNGELEYEAMTNDFFFIFELDEKMNYPRLYSDGDEVDFFPETTLRVKKVTKTIKIIGSGNCRFSLILL